MAGYGGSPPDSGSPGYIASPLVGGTGNIRNTQTVKTVDYKTGPDLATQILSISKSTSSTSVKTPDPSVVIIKNIGSIPVVVASGYQAWTSSTVPAADPTNPDNLGTCYVHTLVNPGESIRPVMRSVVSVAGNTTTTHQDFLDESLYNLDGSVQSFTAPNTTLKVDSTANVKNDTLSNTTDPVNFGVTVSASANSNHIRVGDLIRIENEIMEVLGTYEDDQTASSLVAGDIRCKRGMNGSTIISHTDDPDIYFPCFNEFYDFDRKLSGDSQLVQTDSQGRYKSSNMIGLGRTSGTTPPGITPGSFVCKFYSSSYVEIAMGGSTSNIPINAATDSLLSANTAYTFSISLNDSSSQNVSFTTGTSTKFGGSGGVIAVMQTALDTLCNTTGNTLYGADCTISIKSGMLVFTNNSHLLPHDGTNGAKIELAAGTGTDLFAGSRGIFPALADINEPVIPLLPDNLLYNPITYGTAPNINSFAYDNGHGKIVGACIGDISYETGRYQLISAPKNASFEVSFSYNGPFSGKIASEETYRTNQLTGVYANVLNKYMTGSVEITTL